MSYFKIFNKEMNSEHIRYYKDKECKILHREGKPAVKWKYGGEEWFINGKRHKLDGPAIDFGDGGTVWYKNNMRHREDGPAVEESNGYKEFWLDGVNYLEEEYWEKVESNKRFGVFV